MTKLNSDEPVQLLHRSGDDQQRRVFFPGDNVPEDYIVPDRYLEAGEDAEGSAAPSGGGDGDDDDLDEGDDDDTVAEGVESTEPQLDGAFLDLNLDVAASSVQGIIDAVMAVEETLRDEAARWVMSEESRRPDPRSTLLTAMKKLLP